MYDVLDVSMSTFEKSGESGTPFLIVERFVGMRKVKMNDRFG